MKKAAILIVIVGLVGLGIWKLKGNKTAAVEYQTAVAEKGTLIVALTASGQVAATNSRTVTTTASGVVKKVYVKEGEKVSTGTPLMLIDLDLDGRQQLESAYAQLQSAQNSLVSAQTKIYSLQSSLVNAKNIFDNQWSMQSPDDPTYKQRHNDLLTAQTNFDSQRAAIRQAQTSLNAARLSYQLSSATVYAPISGTVSAISLTTGMVLNPTSSSSSSTNVSNKIAIVKTNATPAISVALTEIDVPKVKVGDQATVTLDALPGKTYTGKITAVDTSGAISSGVVSYTTTIRLDSDVPEILSNMSATASIITDVKDGVVLVPVAAVQTSNGSTIVRELVNGVLTNVPVEVGKSSTTQTEIVSGVKEGETVVTGISGGSTTTRTTTGTSVFGNTRGGFGGFGGGR